MPLKSNPHKLPQALRLRQFFCHFIPVVDLAHRCGVFAENSLWFFTLPDGIWTDKK
jgi:hypothetical protein